ncbi:MAG: tetratricopeptide repeat-containing diguanylate cyclase [Casimicrobium sp.]
MLCFSLAVRIFSLLTTTEGHTIYDGAYPLNPAAAAIAAHLEGGRLQVALDASSAALAVCADRERPMLLCMKSNTLVTLGKPLDALRAATEARELALPMNDARLIAETNLSLAFALQTLEEHGRAIDMAAECQSIAKAQLDHELLARAWRTLAISYSVLGRHQQAIDLLEQVIPLLEEHARSPERVFHARYSLIAARSRLATGRADVDELKQATYRTLLNDWREFAEDVASRELVRLHAMALGNAGIAARFAGDLETALDTLRRALALQETLGLRGHVAVTESHIGAALQALGRSQDAISAFGRAIDLQQDGNPRELASAWEELSQVYESIGDYRAALSALKQTRVFERKIRDDAAHVAAVKLEQRVEIARLADQWTRLASEDALTGMANRRAFDRRLASMLEGVTHGKAFALVMFDLDHFKLINDEHGHAIGDAVLKRFATILRRDRRGDDLAARVGGEEFALLLQVDNVAQARAVAERVRNDVKREPWGEIVPNLAVATSAGVAHSTEIPLPQCDAEHTVALADQRLYKAKNAGRDCIVSTD